MNSKHTGHAKLTMLILVGALAGAAGLTLALRPPPEPQSLKLLPQPRQLTDFALVDGAGQPFGRTQLEGDWDLVFFGFTHCPDVCPGTLNVLAEVTRQLVQRNAAIPRVTFISVDPIRDQPEKTQEYAQYFHPTFRAATGDDAQLSAISRQMGVVYYIPEDAAADVNYNVDHSAAILLIDPQARLAGLFPTPHDPALIADDLEVTLQ